MRSKMTVFKIGNAPNQADLLNSAALNPSADTLCPESYTLCDFSVEKKMMAPNVLRFSINRNAIAPSANMLKFGVASDLVGETVTCQVETESDLDNNNNNSLTFKGSIIKASMNGRTISCEALSDDCNMGSFIRSRCFINMKIKDIVKAVCPGAEVHIHQCFDSLEFPYIIQYNESDYDFLTRLAKRFGAFFYFDQSQGVVFGKPISLANPIELVPPFFGVPNGSGIKFNLVASSPNLRFMAHDYEKDADLNSPLADFKRNGSGHLYKAAAKGSTPMVTTAWDFYLDEPNSLPKTPAANLMELYRDAKLSSFSSEMVTCSCVLFRLDIHVGSVIKLKQNSSPSDICNGVLLVTSSCVTWDCNGSPQNEITALVLPEDNISDEKVFAPYIDANAYPRSSAQRAVVLNNVDPKKMGRVQVKFSWQQTPANDQEKEKIPWIRIAQPYGGNKKGFFVLPEIGEEVMVGFEHENLEKPFVIGTLFHDSDQDPQKQMPDDKWVEAAGDNKANEENEVKAFRTKKGHTIEFHDTKEGNGFIRIYGNNKSDKGNYDIILSTDKIQKVDGQNKEDYVLKSADDKAQASQEIKEIDYKAENLRIMVKSNGGDIMLDAGEGDIFLKAKNIHVNATGNRTTMITGNDVLGLKGEQHVEAKNASIKTTKINIDATGAVEIKSDSISAETKNNTTVKANGQFEIGATKDAKVSANTGLELSGGSKTDLKGTNITVAGDASTLVKAPKVDVQADGVNTVKGATVMIEASAAGTRKGTWTDL